MIHTIAKAIADCPLEGYYLGLMSGTSGDGIDACLIEVKGAVGSEDVKVISQVTVPYCAEIQRDLCDSIAANMGVQQAARWDLRLGELFGQAALDLLEGFADDIVAIGLSGHTFAHLPNAEQTSTLQLGNPAIVAERTASVVIADFRACDVARGGEGAPLVPVADALLFGKQDQNRLVLNLGGISNLTYLAQKGPIQAFDCGPANLVLNKTCQILTGNEITFDCDGAIAAQGKASLDLVENWMQHDFFRSKTRSTGREEFGELWVEQHVESLKELGLEDALATLCRWIAEAIVTRIKSFGIDVNSGLQVLVGGGGVWNQTLMQYIQDCLGCPFRALHSSYDGVGPDERESVAFALLAYLYLSRQESSLSSTTGCLQSGPLGALYLPARLSQP